MSSRLKVSKENCPKNLKIGWGLKYPSQQSLRLDPRISARPEGQEARFDGYPGSSHPPPHPYFGTSDSRNEAARSDPRRYDAHVPPYRPTSVDVDFSVADDEDNLPQGGPIISPCHWDR